MSDNEWKIGKTGEQCQLCGSAFVEGQAYFSALIQTQEQLQRQDFCTECFQSRRPADVYYYWKTSNIRADAQAKKARPVVDIENVLEFFKRLDGESSTQKLAFRYILALMLARKKVLATGDKKKDEQGRSVQMYREKGGGPEHAVIEPELSAEEIQGLSAELGALLGLGQ